MNSLYSSFDESEHKIVGQLGGSDPKMLAYAAKVLQDRGYNEINLNCGCPSKTVSVWLFIFVLCSLITSVLSSCWILLWFAESLNR